MFHCRDDCYLNIEECECDHESMSFVPNTRPKLKIQKAPTSEAQINNPKHKRGIRLGQIVLLPVPIDKD